MQAKDVDTEMLVRMIRWSQFTNPVLPWRYGERIPWAEPIWDLYDFWNDNVALTPEPVFRAKCKKLVRNGYINGCVCSIHGPPCRGDFEVKQKGLALIASD